MSKALLIYPTMVTETPMTLAMLSGIFKEAGYETKSLVNTFKKPLEVEDFIRVAKEYNPDVIGISIITFRILFVYQIIKALKREGFKIIVGGAHPTDCPKEALEAGADAVCIGEGEGVLREWLRDTSVKGILPLKLPIDLSTLPKSDLEVFDQDLFKGKDGFIKGFHRIYTSRGCPGRCTFCDWQVFKQNTRYYLIQSVIDEIVERKEKYGITSFSIADDCFTLNKDYVYEFCKEIKKLGVAWRANSRANLVDREILETMKEAGCHLVAYGFESGDRETLIKIKKGVKLEDNIRAPKLSHEAGLEVYGCLMTGFPWETIHHIENQIKFIHEVWDAVSLFQVSGSLMPFPGSEIYKEYAKQYGFEEYWLNPKYQELGIQVYQNALNPFRVSTFYQRYLFDDTYIEQEYFFKYTPEYKKAVREMVWEIGRHNLLFMFPGQFIKQKLILFISKLSMLGEDLLPGLEKKIGGYLFEKLKK